MHGEGVYRYASGDEYSGSFERGVRCGVGEMRWRNGDVYTGHWSAGERSGQGRYVEGGGIGAVYEGTWLRGKRHGEGLYIQGDESQRQWYFNGQLMGSLSKMMPHHKKTEEIEDSLGRMEVMNI